MKKIFPKLLISALCLLLLMPLLASAALAADLDEIQLYEITVNVNDDATLRMEYHIEWKVLDSDSEGPLSWVEIGVPNDKVLSLQPLGGSVSKVSAKGSYVRVDLDRKYYKGEVADIRFLVVQDYMYQMNAFTAGETVYEFTPGWFDDIRVDQLVIRWNGDRVLSQTPACLKSSDGYFTWTTSLGKGDTYTVSVTYPNDAFGFDDSKTMYTESDRSYDDDFSAGDAVLSFIVVVIIFAFVLIRGSHQFSGTANLSGETQKKITRTRIEYYPECQSCGAARPEGANNCPYCGRSFIKSEEVIKASEIPDEEKALRSKTTDGLYAYTSRPNTFIRVNVVNVPASRSSSHSSRGGGFFGGGGSSHSGGGHSCACASSCACACACACAGGGRAGCSTKDFYNTGLKLRQLEGKKKRR